MVYVDTGPAKGALDPDFSAVEKPMPSLEKLAAEENLNGLSKEQLETLRRRAVPEPGAALRGSAELTNDARLDVPSRVICTGYTSAQHRDGETEGQTWLGGMHALRNGTYVELRPRDSPTPPRTTRPARDAGFQRTTRIETDGHPGVCATLDAGAAKTVAIYFMYDVKQADPAEWSSPPFSAAIVDRPGLGKVLIGRGAVNQKGPEAAFLAALHAIRGAGKKLPVNLVLVAEGEEEIGSPHFRQVVANPDVRAALKRTIGVFMPSAFQDPDGSVSIFLGAKGVVECELVASGENWGRGPTKAVHSSNRARLDSPAFH